MPCQLAELVYYKVGSSLQESLAGGVAIRHSAGACAGPHAHQDIYRHVAYNQCLAGAVAKVAKSFEYRLRIGFCREDIFFTKHIANILRKAEIAQKRAQRRTPARRGDTEPVAFAVAKTTSSGSNYDNNDGQGTAATGDSNIPVTAATGDSSIPVTAAAVMLVISAAVMLAARKKREHE